MEKSTTRRPVKLSLTRNNIDPEAISLDCSVTSGHENVDSIDLKRLTSKGLEDIDDFISSFLDNDNRQLIVDLENIVTNYGNFLINGYYLN